jgi:hypothetical protein
LHNISVCGYCHIYQFACFLFFVFDYYIWPIIVITITIVITINIIIIIMLALFGYPG